MEQADVVQGQDVGAHQVKNQEHFGRPATDATNGHKLFDDELVGHVFPGIDVHRLRVLARPYGVVKVDAAPGVIHITFKKDPPIDSMAIIHLIQKNRHIKLAGNEKLRIERELKEPKDRAQMVRDVLRSLGQPKAEVAAMAVAG